MIESAAQARVNASKRGPVQKLDIGTVEEILARGPAPEPRIENLMPADAGTLIVAPYKAGKTTFVLNLAKSLVTGEDFLGQLGVRKLDGCVALLNFEVSGHMVATWAAEHGIPRDRLVLVNLRGARNPLADDADSADLARQLGKRSVECLIVDPFGRAYTSENQNDSGRVAAFLNRLDQFTRAAIGATDLILTAHAGRNGDHARGASALEDWADSTISLMRSKANSDLRFVSAEGRDVLLEEDQLSFDKATRTLSLTDTGSRAIVSRAARLEKLMEPVLGFIRANGPSTGNQIDNYLAAGAHPHQKGDGAKAGYALCERGLATSRLGARSSVIFEACPPTSAR